MSCLQFLSPFLFFIFLEMRKNKLYFINNLVAFRRTHWRGCLVWLTPQWGAGFRSQACWDPSSQPLCTLEQQVMECCHPAMGETLTELPSRLWGRRVGSEPAGRNSRSLSLPLKNVNFTFHYFLQPFA